MKNLINLLVATFFLTVLPFAKADSRRFYAGNILRAELMPCEESEITIKNQSKYEPELNIADPGYALITVNVDQGRSLSIYDYYLVYGADEFPCIALMTPTGAFDKDIWEIRKTRPDKKYTMLFKVPMPPRGKTPYYSLRFRLTSPGKVKDVQLQLTSANDGFTPVKVIPLNGMLGQKAIASTKGKGKRRKSKKRRSKKGKKTAVRVSPSDNGGTEEAQGAEQGQRKPNKGELEPPKKIDPKLRKKNDLDAWNSFGG
jgi:hypothetical protein